MTTKQEQSDALNTLMNLILDTIREAGSAGIPEGHLYAALMTIPNFRVEHLNMMLQVLEAKGLVKSSNYLVKAVL